MAKHKKIIIDVAYDEAHDVPNNGELESIAIELLAGVSGDAIVEEYKVAVEDK